MWKLIASKDYDSVLGYNLNSSTTYVANTLEEIDTIIKLIENYAVGEFTYSILPPRDEESAVEPVLKEDKKNE